MSRTPERHPMAWGGARRSARGGPRRSLLVPATLALALTGLAACSSDPLGPSGKELNENRERWRAQGITSYAFDYQLSCFCGTPGIQPVRIEVREGEVVEVTLKQTDEPVDPTDFPTVEDLFQMIEDALERDPFRFEASYHPQLGHPVDFFVDYEQYVNDEEIGFTVADLVALESGSP